MANDFVPPRTTARTSRVIVKMAEGVSKEQHDIGQRLEGLLSMFGCSIERGPNRQGRILLSTSADTDIATLLATLNSREDVAYAELDTIDSEAEGGPP